MDSRRHEQRQGRGGIDRQNVTLGAAVSGLLTGLLGYGTFALFQKLTPDIGMDEGLWGLLAMLLAAFLGAAFTAWRGRRRYSRSVPEGTMAGLLGFTAAAVGVYALAGGVRSREILYLLPTLLWGIPAAYAGALWGGRWSERSPTKQVRGTPPESTDRG